MLPMGFAPRSGALVDALPPANLTAGIGGEFRRQTLQLATDLLDRVRTSGAAGGPANPWFPLPLPAYHVLTRKNKGRPKAA